MPSLDANSHPDYGTNYRSGDWLRLWNLAYTYSVGGPNAQYTANIESEHHQCAAIFVADAEGGLTLRDFAVAAETHDPIGNPWQKNW